MKNLSRFSVTDFYIDNTQEKMIKYPYNLSMEESI